MSSTPKFFSLLFWLGLALLPCRTFAQSASPHEILPDKRLFEAFDSAYIFSVQQHNPTLLRRWNFYLDNAFVIADWSPEKGDIAALPVVKIADPAHVNILVLENEQHLARDWERSVFYRVNHSNQVLIYLPGKVFMEKFTSLFEMEH